MLHACVDGPGRSHECERGTQECVRHNVTEEGKIVGLCATCKNVRRVTSDRGSRFYLCELSKVDARFPKYPRLPVLNCSGYIRIEANQ